MSSDFPFVIDRIAITKNWSLLLPFACKLRIEEDSMVLWRPGFTIFIEAWGNENEESMVSRKENFAEMASPDEFDMREHEEAGRLYYSYRLDEESDDQRVAALYALVFTEDGHLSLSFYFDSEEDADAAYSIFHSANSDPATIADTSVFSRTCFATNMVMEDGEPVGYMYREEPDNEDDSGWRFFSGTESQDYVDEPDNTQLYPVAFVCQSTPEIVPYLLAEIGSQLERKGSKFKRV